MRISIIVIMVMAITACSQNQKLKYDTKVDLRGKQLKNIPSIVYKNSIITYLDLGSSEVTFYPPLSSPPENLTNSISNLSEQIGDLVTLQTLILNSNKLKSLPNSITKLVNLEVLDLSINEELDIMQELDKLTKLPKLRVLKIVDVKMTESDQAIIKSAFKPETKVIMTIPEYFEDYK
jgi:Leucine-rich repeat (LRR) protein